MLNRFLGTALMVICIFRNTIAQSLPDTHRNEANPTEVIAEVRPLLRFTQEQVTQFQYELASGDRYYHTGLYMASGGLAGLIVSTVVPIAGGVGGLAYLMGLPVMGNASDQVSDLALKVNPSYKSPGSGWGYYSASWALIGVGIVWSLVEVIRQTGSDFRRSENNLILPLGILFSGVGCQGISWYKFSAKHRAGHRSVVEGLKLSLTTKFQGGINTQPGILLSRQF